LRGDLLDEPVDAIVNAANGHLAHGGGVAGMGVIHAVGPRQGEVSFPAVSSGIFAVPLDVCARAYLRAMRASPLSQVRLCLRDQPVIDAVFKELGK